MSSTDRSLTILKYNTHYPTSDHLDTWTINGINKYNKFKYFIIIITILWLFDHMSEQSGVLSNSNSLL